MHYSSRFLAILLVMQGTFAPLTAFAYVSPDEVFRDNDGSEVLYYNGNSIQDVTQIEQADAPQPNTIADEATDYAGLYLVLSTVLLFSLLYLITLKRTSNTHFVRHLHP